MLLPSEELRELSKRVDVCLSGKTTPPGCDVRFRQFYWLMVFDGRGELMAASNLADGLRRQQQLGKSLPVGLVALVDEGLKAGPSLEQLERRYIAERGAKAAYEALLEKVEAMDGVAQMRAAGFLVEAAPRTADPGLSRARGILTEAAACDHQVINHAAYAALRKSIDEFMQRHPSHPAAADLIAPLTDVALKYSFDLQSICATYAQEWIGSVGDRSVREGLRAQAKRLLDHCASEIEAAEEELRGMKPGDYGRLRRLSRLGRARETLDGLEQTETFGVMRPIHAEWKDDATAKFARQK